MTLSCVFWFQPHFLKPRDSKTRPVPRRTRSTLASARLNQLISLNYIWKTKVGQLRTQRAPADYGELGHVIPLSTVSPSVKIPGQLSTH